MTDAKVEHTAVAMLKSDKELSESKDFKTLHEQYAKPASDESVQKTVKALTAKGHKVNVFDTAAEALKFLQTIAPEGATVSSGHSITLKEIGFVDWIKTQTKWTDYKAQIVAAQGKNDWKTAGELQKKANVADYWFASCGAIAETGEINWASLTGTRVQATSTGNIVFVAGTNKIVPTEADARKRLYEYQLPLESARARAVYGVPASTAAEEGSIRAGNPYAQGRVHVVLVKGAFGY